MRMTAVSAGIHPEPDAIKAEKAQGSDTVWIRFGEYPAHATLFLDRATARALREALADAEALMGPEPQPLPDELAPEPEEGPYDPCPRHPDCDRMHGCEPEPVRSAVIPGDTLAEADPDPDLLPF